MLIQFIFISKQLILRLSAAPKLFAAGKRHAYVFLIRFILAAGRLADGMDRGDAEQLQYFLDRSDTSLNTCYSCAQRRRKTTMNQCCIRM